MAFSSNSGTAASRPLWVIAIALLTIAVCLMLLVLEKQFREPVPAKLATQPLPEKPQPSVLNFGKPRTFGTARTARFKELPTENRTAKPVLPESVPPAPALIADRETL